jgi:hypothetical protein
VLTDFIPSALYTDLVSHLRELIVKPTNDRAGEWAFPAVEGPMGSGKTTATKFAMQATAQGAPATHAVGIVNLRVDRLLDALGNMTWTSMDASELLARVLIWATDPNSNGPYLRQASPVVWGGVESAIIASIVGGGGNAQSGVPKKTVLLFHVDEAQAERKLAAKLVDGCAFTLLDCNASQGLKVICVVSGVLPLGRQGLVSRVNVRKFETAPFTDSALMPSFIKSIGCVSDFDMTADEHLYKLYTMCGGSPHLVKALAVQLGKSCDDVTFLNHWNEIRQGKAVLLVERASHVCQGVLKAIQDDYGEARWHEAAGGMTPREGYRRPVSWDGKTKPILTRLYLDVMLETQVEYLTTPVLPSFAAAAQQPVTYENVIGSGLVRHLDKTTKTLKVPMFGLICLEQLIQVFPSSARMSEPFLKGWETNERVALASLYLRLYDARLRGLAEVSLTSLRPGAQWCPRAEGVFMQVPQMQDLRWEFLGKDVENDMQAMKGKLKPGFFGICKPDQKTVDGIVSLQCRVTGVAGVKATTVRKALAVSQSKAKSLHVDEDNTKPLYNGTILSKFLPRMRDIAGLFINMKEDVVVCDVFSTRASPEDEAFKIGMFDPTQPLNISVRAPLTYTSIVRAGTVRHVLGESMSELAYVKNARVVVGDGAAE